MEEANSRRSSRVATPTGSNCFPDSILDIEEKVRFIIMMKMMMLMMTMMITISIQVAYMSDVVDRAASATPTDRVSLSR